MTLSMNSKNFVRLSEPFPDDNYRFQIFQAQDGEQLLKLLSREDSFIVEQVRRELAMTLELSHKLNTSENVYFPNIVKHLSGIAVRDFVPICSCQSQRLPAARPATRRRLRRLASEIMTLQKELNTISEGFDGKLGRNRRQSLELHEENRFEELAQLQRFDAALIAILSVCDATAEIHKLGYLHLEISTASIGLDRKNQIQLLPSLPYGPGVKVRRRHYSNCLGGHDLVPPELHTGAVATPATDVYLIARLFIRYLIQLNGSSNRSLPQLHEMQLAKRLIPEPCHNLIQIIEKATSSEPSNRHQSVELLREQITQVFHTSEPGGVHSTQEHQQPQCIVALPRKQSVAKQRIIIGLSLSLVVLISCMLTQRAMGTADNAKESPPTGVVRLVEEIQPSTMEDDLESGVIQLASGIHINDSHQIPSESVPRSEPQSSAETRTSQSQMEETVGEEQVEKEQSEKGESVSPPLAKLATALINKKTAPALNQYEDLIERAFRTVPERIYGPNLSLRPLELPSMTLACDCSWSLMPANQPAIAQEFERRFMRTARAARSIARNQEQFLLQQHALAQSIFEGDFRLDLITAIGLERIGEIELAEANYANAYRKWALLVQSKDTPVRQAAMHTDLPMKFYIRALLNRKRPADALSATKKMVEIFTNRNQIAPGDQSTVPFASFVLAHIEVSHCSNSASLQLTHSVALNCVQRLRLELHKRVFAEHLLEYRDFLISSGSGESANWLRKLDYDAVIDSLVGSLQRSPWESEELSSLSQTQQH